MTSIIIPCLWINDEYIDMTERLLYSMEQHGRPNQVILVDDGSPIKMGHQNYYVKQAGAQIVTLSKNKGYPAACNEGARFAKGDILIFCNNDIEMSPDWLTALLELFPKYDIGHINVSDSDGFVTEDKISTDEKFGSLFAIKSKVWNDLKGFDEKFGIGTFEDDDLRDRAKKKGYKIGKNHKRVVRHEGRKTFDKVDPNKEMFKKNKEIYEDKISNK